MKFHKFSKLKNIIVNILSLNVRHKHCVKSVRIQNYSGPYFTAYSPNAEKYEPE